MSHLKAQEAASSTAYSIVPAVGDVVIYEDQANAAEIYVIVGLPVARFSPSGFDLGKSGYFLRSTRCSTWGSHLDSRANTVAAITESDLRQNGWSIWSDDLKSWVEVEGI